MAATRRKPKDFYVCYLKFFRAQQRDIAKLLGEKINATEKPMSRQELKDCLCKMNPDVRKEYRKMIRGTYAVMVKRGMQLAERQIRAFKTDPKVRARVEQRLQRLLPQFRK